jgi:hypothetical protein
MGLDRAGRAGPSPSWEAVSEMSPTRRRFFHGRALDHRTHARQHAEGERVLRIHCRAGGVTHDAAARANQLQGRDLDWLSIDTYYDKPAAHREPIDRRCHCFGAGDGRQHRSRSAEAIECRSHILGRAVNEVVSPQLAGERLLVGPTGDRDGAETELIGELHPEMAKAADAQDRDHVARHRPAVAERIEGRDPGAEQRRGIGGAKLVWNRSKRMSGSHHRLGIPAVIRNAGYAQIAAVDQPTTPARLAMPAIPSKPADADALPGAPAQHAGADCVDHAGNLVPWDARKGEVGPLPFDRETVAVAHTAGLDADTDLAPRRLGHFALDEFERAASPRTCTARIFAIAAS